MSDHFLAYVEEVDDDCWVAACSCGWQTEVLESEMSAVEEFDSIHFFGTPRDEEEVPDTVYVPDNSCSFCGHEGHSQKNCPRKPLYKV